ncbi:hypothetical protein HA49_08615 [Tatumella morbirosei]|uniref:Uncharacterized protein n=1 Tax=Tatumella morbirosei TaxID=642227 RepID=A0A095TF11_9GAMM|nr:hypothetical protein [Tatumella morbirosei]KGD75282.1 hypothetical protein HA49_08615 [Tatumella morbirosei]
MHPVIQLIIAISSLIVAIRFWPPLLYIIAALGVVLLLTKITRRSVSLVRNNKEQAAKFINAIAPFAGFVVLAIIADTFFPHKIKALTIVLCFGGAFIIISAIVGVFEKIKRQ